MTRANFLKVTLGACLLASIFSVAHAASIQMLPPVESGGGTLACAQTAGVNKLLTWDGQTPINCQANLVLDSSGKLGVGTAQPRGWLHVLNPTGAASVVIAGKPTMQGGYDHVSDFLIGENSTNYKAWDIAVRGPGDMYSPNGLEIAHFSNALGNRDYNNPANWSTGLGISQTGAVNIATERKSFRLNVGTETNGSTNYPAFGVADSGDIIVSGGSDAMWAIYDFALRPFMSWNIGNGHLGLAGNPDAAFTVRVNGSFYADAGGIGAASDERLKKDIKPIEHSLDKVMELNGVTYKWRKDVAPERKFPDTQQVGVIAQNVEKVLPEAVMTDGEGYKVVDYGRLSALLIEAMKEMKTEHDKEIKALRAEIDKLKAGK